MGGYQVNDEYVLLVSYEPPACAWSTWPQDFRRKAHHRDKTPKKSHTEDEKLADAARTRPVRTYVRAASKSQTTRRMPIGK